MSERVDSPTSDQLFDLLELLSNRRRMRYDGYLGLPPTLTSAAWRGDLEMVDLFLEKGASVDEKIGGSSPLAAAMRSGDPQVVLRLLGAGAKPDAENAADTAAERGRTDLLELLFEAGLDPASRRAQFALTSAAINGKATSMRCLLARGVTINPYDRNFTANMAESNGHTEIAAFVRGKRSDLEGVPDAETKSFVTFRREPRPEDDWSDEQIEAEALSLVKHAGIDLERKNRHGRSLLNAAIEAESVAVAEAALDRGADVGSERGRASAIAEAAAHGLHSIVERLVPRAPQGDLDEALLEAANGGYHAIVETLLTSNADPTFANEGGESAYGRASGPYRDEIRALIRRALRERGSAAAPALGVVGRARKNIAGLRGVRELVKSQTDMHPDWTIIAVRKPIDEVSPQLTSIYGAARSELDVAQRGVIGATAGVFVFALKGHAWTIELRSVGFHHRGRWEADDAAVAMLSRQAACQTLLCVGSDTSGTFGAYRYDRGEPVETMEWTFAEADAADAHFTSLELFLPGCRVDAGGVSPRLDLVRIDPASVERLDYIILEE